MNPPGNAIIGESAFVTKSMEGKVVRARKKNESSDIPKGLYISAIDMMMK